MHRAEKLYKKRAAPCCGRCLSFHFISFILSMSVLSHIFDRSVKDIHLIKLFLMPGKINAVFPVQGLKQFSLLFRLFSSGVVQHVL